MAKPDATQIRKKATSHEGAAVAGIMFSVLYIAGLIILQDRPVNNASNAEWESWIMDPANRTQALLGLNLMAFASVAFLWFMAVVRRRIGDREGRFFSTVFLGSGLLTVALLLVGSSAVAVVPLAAQSELGGQLTGSDGALMAMFGRVVALVILPRLQALFVITTSTLTLRTGTFGKYLAVLGYVIGVGMMIVPILFDLLSVAFPAWVLVISVAILFNRETLGLDRSKRDHATSSEGMSSKNES